MSSLSTFFRLFFLTECKILFSVLSSGKKKGRKGKFSAAMTRTRVLNAKVSHSGGVECSCRCHPRNHAAQLAAAAEEEANKRFDSSSANFHANPIFDPLSQHRTTTCHCMPCQTGSMIV